MTFTNASEGWRAAGRETTGPHRSCSPSRARPSPSKFAGSWSGAVMGWPVTARNRNVSAIVSNEKIALVPVWHEGGELFDARIAPFTLAVPNALN